MVNYYLTNFFFKTNKGSNKESRYPYIISKINFLLIKSFICLHHLYQYLQNQKNLY